MRVLAPLILLSLAAACGGGSHSTPTLTTQAGVPFTPAEETLTPPDIDTSGWLVYRDAEHGFGLEYPPDARLKEAIYPDFPSPNPNVLGTKIDLPFTSGTTLEGKYIFITATDVAAAGACVPPELASIPQPGAATPDVRSVRSGAIAFWRTHGTFAMMMQRWYHSIYMTARGSSCVTIDALLNGISSGASVDTPLPPADDAKESETFTAIVATFRWTPP